MNDDAFSVRSFQMKIVPADEKSGMSDPQMMPPIHLPISTTHAYDGVICFGGVDWWYHNRGHYDLQMMREMSRTLPVLYVNSIGMRMPRASEGRMFLRRMARKVRSLGRGHVFVRDQFAVYSPLTIPGKIGTFISGRFLAMQVRRAAAKMNIRRPLVWIACPPGAVAVDGLRPAAVVYQRTDRHESFASDMHDQIVGYDRWLKARSDLTVYCSRHLYEEEVSQCRKACLIEHGVDFEMFSKAGRTDLDQPEEMKDLPHPRVGFVGGIDRHTFDPDLFLDVAKRLPGMQFVLVGGCSLEPGWCDLPNVTLLGRKPYEDVATYMAACDVLIMPWNKSRWIEACNPIKLKEYLAVGRPIVSTDFPEVRRYARYLRIADRPEDFARAIQLAVDSPGDVQSGREFIQHDTWHEKSQALLGHMTSSGIHPENRAQLMKIVTPAQEKDIEPEVIREGTVTVKSSQASDVLAIIGASRRKIDINDCLGDVTSQTEGESNDDALVRAVQKQLAACLILSGGLQPTPLSEETGLSVLDLPLTASNTVLDVWVEAIRALPFNSEVPIRVIHDGPTYVPSGLSREIDLVDVEIQPRALRGTAGVVADACREYDPDSSVLVVEGSRYSVSGLNRLLCRHFESGADITLGRNPDQSPSGMYIVRCGACELVPGIGYMDFKEQWLERLRRNGHRIEVQDVPAPGSMPIHTLEQLLAAARLANTHVTGRLVTTSVANGLIRNSEAQGLRVICPGALVGPGARVIDSIVMSGAVVPSNAIIVRSLICSKGPIQSGAEIADAVISARASLSDHG